MSIGAARWDVEEWLRALAAPLTPPPVPWRLEADATAPREPERDGSRGPTTAGGTAGWRARTPAGAPVQDAAGAAAPSAAQRARATDAALPDGTRLPDATPLGASGQKAAGPRTAMTEPPAGPLTPHARRRVGVDEPGAATSRPGATAAAAPPLFDVPDADPSGPGVGDADTVGAGRSRRDAMLPARPGHGTVADDSVTAGTSGSHTSSAGTSSADPLGPDTVHPGTPRRDAMGPGTVGRDTPATTTVDPGTVGGGPPGSATGLDPLRRHDMQFHAGPTRSGAATPYGPRTRAAAATADHWPQHPRLAPATFDAATLDAATLDAATLDAALAPLLPRLPSGAPADVGPAASLPRYGIPPGAHDQPTTAGCPDSADIEDLADLLAGLLEDEARALGVLELEP